MPLTFEAIEAEALGLSPADRARLVEKLISSLEIDREVEDAWSAEVERRSAELEGGSVFAIPGPEALAKLKSELR